MHTLLALAALAALVGGAATPDRAEYRRVAAELDSNLRRDILAPWYPRAVDLHYGGFTEDYGEAWQPLGPETTRSIVYQSRLTWVAGRVPEYDRKVTDPYPWYVRHGVEWLRDAMWDKQEGGFYWQIDAATRKPTAARGGEKHAYGNAFGIYAAARAYEATHDPAALDLAKRAFGWMEAHAHDAARSGYYEALTREGKPILTAPPENPKQTDEIGTQYGQKSMNTHIHLLEALTELHHVWPDPLVRKRLDEVFHLVRDRVYTEPGYLTMFFQPDWTAASHEDSYGHDIETAYLLTEAAAELGQPEDAQTWRNARRLVDHALQHGWDAVHGGFYDHGPANGPAEAMQKVWWTQAEGLNALLLMHARYGKDDPRYWRAFLQQWAFIRDHQVDHAHGGWYSTVRPDGSPIPNLAKSDAWTDPYHEGRAVMHCAELLRKLADGHTFRGSQ